MGRKKRNTIQRSVWMHPETVETVREVAKYLTDIEIKKENQPKTESDENSSDHNAK